MADRPTGTVSFLSTDLEGSTARWEQQPAAMRAAAARHDALVRDAIAAHYGHVFRTAGDGRCAAVAGVPDAQRTRLLAVATAIIAVDAERRPPRGRQASTRSTSGRRRRRPTAVASRASGAPSARRADQAEPARPSARGLARCRPTHADVRARPSGHRCPRASTGMRAVPDRHDRGRRGLAPDANGSFAYAEWPHRGVAGARHRRGSPLLMARPAAVTAPDRGARPTSAPGRRRYSSWTTSFAAGRAVEKMSMKTPATATTSMQIRKAFVRAVS